MWCVCEFGLCVCVCRLVAMLFEFVYCCDFGFVWFGGSDFIVASYVAAWC